MLSHSAMCESSLSSVGGEEFIDEPLFGHEPDDEHGHYFFLHVLSLIIDIKFAP
jgi:hypothetical protein